VAGPPLREPLRGRGQGAGAGPWRPRAPELSDRTQSFWTSDDLVIWSTPAYLEFCVSPCILYADEPAVIEQALLWIQANHPELSIERSEAAR
jgi:hypothetical protein